MIRLLISVHYEQSKRRIEKPLPRTWSANNSIHLQIWSDALPFYRYWSSQGDTSVCYYRVHCALEPKLNKMVVRKYADARDKPDTLEAIFRWQNNAPRRCWRQILLIIVILLGFHPPSMKFQMLK